MQGAQGGEGWAQVQAAEACEAAQLSRERPGQPVLPQRQPGQLAQAAQLCGQVPAQRIPVQVPGHNEPSSHARAHVYVSAGSVLLAPHREIWFGIQVWAAGKSARLAGTVRRADGPACTYNSRSSVSWASPRGTCPQRLLSWRYLRVASWAGSKRSSTAGGGCGRGGGKGVCQGEAQRAHRKSGISHSLRRLPRVLSCGGTRPVRSFPETVLQARRRAAASLRTVRWALSCGLVAARPRKMPT